MTDKQAIEALASAGDKLERLTRLYAMLSRINRSIVRLDDPYELYESACRIAVEEGGFLFAWIGLLEPAGARMQAVARAGAPVEFGRVGAGVAESPEGWSATGAAIREGRPCIVNDVDAELSPQSPWKAILCEVGAGSAAALPLMMDNAVVGVLVVGANKAGCFLDSELQLLNEVAEDISFALRMMRREEERLAAETKIQYLAYYDAETGLPGRALLAERLAAAGERVVLAVSLRRYHAILQALGQAAGVELGRTVAERMERLLPTAVVGRFNSSEFGSLLQLPEGLHAVEEIVWQLHQGLAEPFQIDGSEVFLDPFIGIAMHPRDGDAAEAIDAAVLAAGSGAKGADGFCRFFVAGMDGGSRHQLDMEAALRRALERGELELHYQPQVDVTSGRIVGAEALLRWQRPGHGLVLPSQFVPMLEATGLIVPVGEWVIAEACACAKRWQAEGLMPLRMAVNLSARQFQNGDVGEMVRRTLADTGLEHRWLELEVTESAVLLNAEAVIRTLNELKAQGVSHALDDFGTGYSSLSYLQRLPVSRIKIDQSFVASVTSNPQSAAIVRAVVGMAHNLKLTVIAEGVETDGQLAFLRGLGCEEIQGYYFSRPLPGDEFAALLRENRCIPAAPLTRPRERVLLVVDDEVQVLSALRRSLRYSDFHILTATCAQEGFESLATHPVGVVLCDQRMAEMTGTEFLRRVRELYPDAVRIVLSGYTDLNSVIDAVNRGAVYKFMTTPWDDTALLECLDDAFRLHEVDRQNRELSLRLSEVIGRAH